MYTAQEIANILGVKNRLAFPKSLIKTLLLDSRKLNMTTQSLFFSIAGDRLDGHNYIENLYKKGVQNFVVEKEFEQAQYPSANFFVVKNSIIALQKITTFHRKQYKIPIIGITGSNGKTIVKEWCHQLLQEDYAIVRSPKSYNSQIGVPLSVWNINNRHQLGIFEAGISEPSEMERLEKIISPSIGIFTNIGSAHSQNFIGEVHKVKEKMHLFVNSDILIYCKDHTVVNQTITSLWANPMNDDMKAPQLFTWSTQHKDANIYIEKKEVVNGKTVISLTYNSQSITLEIPFHDSSSVENALHCIALMLYLNIEEKIINNRLQNLQRIAMRLDQKQGINACTIINDSYNSDIDSLKIALDFLAQQQQNEKKTVILSDILQSGLSGIDLYSSVSEMLKQSKIDKFIGIGDAVAAHQYLFEDIEETYFYTTTPDFLATTIDNDFQHEAILLKGARKFHFERINALLEEKAHATILEVNLNALIHNLQLHTSMLKKGTKVMVMVKAFSYGAGTHEIAKLLEHHRADYLGVAYADEGIALRKAGIKLPIMVLNPEVRSFEAMIRYQLEPEIYSFRLLQQFLEVLQIAQLKNAYPIHVNIDTGMKRMGFEQEDIDKLGQILASNYLVEVVSIFSHLAAADEQESDDFTKNQIETFDTLSKDLTERLPNQPIRHICNTNGIVRFSNAHFDMVRLGVGLYGFGTAKEIQNVSTLKSSISQIKNIEKGETVGYSRKGVANKNMTIATVAIGYADGLNRLLSNGVGEIYLHEKRAKIVGNICMDMCMIDVTDIENVQEGDVVEIFGANISVNEIAQQINTIPYEVLTAISERVKRVFFME